MCKNIELRLFILKAFIFRVLWLIVQVYNDTTSAGQQCGKTPLEPYHICAPPWPSLPVQSPMMGLSTQWLSGEV